MPKKCAWTDIDKVSLQYFDLYLTRRKATQLSNAKL